MDIALRRFNLYLALVLGAFVFCGCQTAKNKKVETTLRVHAEATENDSFTRQVKIFKDESVTMRVRDSALLSDVELVDARIVEAMGGFALAFKFNPTGKWQLDHHTSLNIGRHLAIYVLFGEDPSVSRWLAAPIISSRISDGMILFTPDCTREEAEIIVQGLPKEDTSAKPGLGDESEAGK